MSRPRPTIWPRRPGPDRRRERPPAASGHDLEFGAVEPDPPRAALDAVFAAAVTFGRDDVELLGAVRRAVPITDTPTPP
jgi:hypothetical protein